MSMTYLANLVLILHFLYVLGVVSPIPLIPIGWARDWPWVRSRRIRALHVGMMGFVLFEILVGMACPLTDLENQFLAAAGRSGYQDEFVSSWVTRIMYWQMPQWFFIALYVTIFTLIIYLWWRYPPVRK